jgi:predicted ATP-binding protein involved in virulence
MSHLTKVFINTQFIVTAHSPLIVQADVDANIILLERDGDRVRVNQDLEMVKNWRVDQILTSDLFKLDSARPPFQAAIIDERTKILSKPDLTDQDKTRLKELNVMIHKQPMGETKIEREAEEIIRDAASWLKQTRNG